MTTPSAGERWTMLIVLCAGFFAATLNWFDVATAFTDIGAEFRVGLGPVSLLISLFIVAYAICHIPGGVLATRFGVRRVLVIGLLIEGGAGIVSGLAGDYSLLAGCRVVAGAGAGIFIAVAFGAAAVWFPGRQVTLALGLSSGAAFGLGAAAALYLWIYLQQATNWHVSLVAAGILAVLAALAIGRYYRTPPGMPALHGTSLDRGVLTGTLRDGQLWVYSISMLGGYGAYFTAAQLLSEYVTGQRHLSVQTSGLVAAAVPFAGIAGSLVAAAAADRTRNIRGVVVGSLVVAGALVALLPVTPDAALWLVGLGIGFFVIFGFTAWSAIPTRVSMVSGEHLGTATGLMLTIAGAGGILVPIAFGQVVENSDFATGWVLLGALTVVLALAGVTGRQAGAG